MINLIVAMTDDGRRVIGFDGGLPWKLREDMKRFKELTMGHPVIMGRKTHGSIPIKLKGRREIVLTRDESYQPKTGSVAVTTRERALAWVGHEDVFVLGGVSIFEMFLPIADRLYVTWVDGYEGPGDTFFPVEIPRIGHPDPNLGWVEEGTVLCVDSDEKNEYSSRFAIYGRAGGGSD
jgi:dihydrofolate reductase